MDAAAELAGFGLNARWRGWWFSHRPPLPLFDLASTPISTPILPL